MFTYSTKIITANSTLASDTIWPPAKLLNVCGHGKGQVRLETLKNGAHSEKPNW